MVKDAERFRQEDQKRQEEVQVRNNADSLIYQAEKLMRDQGDQVPSDLKSEVEGKVEACRSALQGQDIAHIQSSVQALSEALQKVGASMYQQPGSPPPEGEGYTPPPGDDEDVVEGEFSEA
jgi:molecular chaperone DnaK